MTKGAFQQLVLPVARDWLAGGSFPIRPITAFVGIISLDGTWKMAMNVYFLPLRK